MNRFLLLTVLLFGFNFWMFSQTSSSGQANTSPKISYNKINYSLLPVDSSLFCLRANYRSVIKPALVIQKARVPAKLEFSEQYKALCTNQEGDLSALGNVPTRTTVYNIRIIKPNPAVDYKLKVVKPDPTVDYKLRVIDRNPDLSAANATLTF